MPIAYGILRYDPRLPDRFDPWWVIVQCDDALRQRLAGRVLAQHGLDLEPPPWGIKLIL